jgi:peptide chain release factor subunit 1
VTVITEAAVRELAGYRGKGAPVTTCYLDVDGRRLSRFRDCEQELDRILRSARSRANGTPSVCRDLERIEAFVRGGIDRSHTRGLAMFSCAADGFWQVVELPVPVRSRVVINQAPVVGPLESVAQEFDRFAVLLADKQRARVLVFHFGELLEHSELLDEPPHEDEHRGHLDRGALDGRSNDAHVQAHLRRAAQGAFDIFQAEPFEHLTIGAPDTVARSLESVLHPYLRKRVCGRIAVGVGASTTEIREAVLDVERDVERDRERDAVERLREAAARQRGVLGLDAALRALVAHRADQLLVSAGYSEAGWRCGACGHLGSVGRVCPTCTGELVPVDDIVEEAVEIALAQSCHVEMCVDNADLDVMGRIGALLRY